MGRPATHTEDAFLDAAADLFAAGGTRAVAMGAVARAVRAPSGSIYHRFPSRAALLAALWLRTARRFHADYLEQLGPGRPGVERAIGATAWVVDWCRDNPSAARVLHAGVRSFELDTWPEGARAQWQELAGEQERSIRRVVSGLADQTGLPAREVTFVLVDLPLAAVRRALLAQERPGPATTLLVRDLATRLLVYAASDRAGPPPPH